jgi:hypothetical protein
VKLTKIKIFLIWFYILGIINIPYFCFAEIQIEVQEGEINVEMVPNNPQPYDDITINLSSYSTDLSKAIINWSGPTGTILSGIGKKSYSFKAGGPGSTSTVDIIVTPVGGVNTINKRITITPSEVEIMWESVDGYVPPFYKGKSLPISGSTIRAVAIPNTDTIKSGIGSISYIWKNTGEVIPDSSGYNKNSYVFKNSVFDGENMVTVVASSVNSNYAAENTTKIPIYKPKILFYKKSPIEGIIYNNALNKETYMQEDEMTIVALPYFLSTKGNEKNLSYYWQTNGKNIQTPIKKSELTIRPSSRGGFATINIEVENLKELFQTATNQLKINL